MLTHLENFDLSSLLIYFDWFHILLIDCLNCYFLAIGFVGSQFDQTKLSFAEIVLDGVEVEHV